MEEFIESIQYILPALLLVIVTWYLVRSFMDNFEKQRKIEFMMKSHEITVPLRLQAYERITLFLERISIDSLLTRLSQPGMNSRQMQSELLASIRSEFEHNLSQQVYISAQAWEMVKNARAQMIKIVNTASDKTDPNAPALELSRNILEGIGEYSKSPTQIAIDFLKDEIQGMF
jgi:hypothetical protein